MSETETNDARNGEVEQPRSTAELADRGKEAESEESEPTEEGGREPLFGGEDADRFREKWQGIQGLFVDEPRRAVEEGDALVATLMQRLAETFADERASLEEQWGQDDDVSTEDLRVALQRYRNFFDRMLSA
ncbi:hypothetical protein BH09ACT13_BH09ACT13_16280 [soil metagenome]